MTDEFTDPWPVPDKSTVEAAAAAFLDNDPRVAQFDDDDVAHLAASPRFSAAVAAIWADRLPTPDAYQRASRALDKHHEGRRALIADMEEAVAEMRAAKSKSTPELARLIGWQEALEMVKQHLGEEPQ